VPRPIGQGRRRRRRAVRRQATQRWAELSELDPLDRTGDRHLTSVERTFDAVNLR
jgi:hypothetical protein